MEAQPSQVVLTKIESIIFEVLSTLVKSKKPPAFTYPTKDRKSDKITNSVVSFEMPSQRPQFSLLVYVMCKIFDMVVHDKTCTVRDVFYNDVRFFKSQKKLEAVLNRICFITRIRRLDLPIQASAKGQIVGDLSWTNVNGVRITLDDFNRKGMLITTSLLDMEDIQSTARFILFVEKDAIFQLLLNGNFLEELKVGNFVMMTGKGYADRLTRRVLNQLSIKLAIPTVALVDGDPFGLDIVANLKWGSSVDESLKLHEDSYEDLISEDIIPDIHWVGLRPTDFCKEAEMKDKLMPLTESDKKKFQFVQRRAAKNGEDDWVHEIDIALRENVKAELEAMCNFLPKILQQRIENYLDKPKRRKQPPLQSSQNQMSQYWRA